MTRFDWYRRWLVADGCLISGFGVVMAVTSGTQLFAPFHELVNPAFWSAAEPDRATAEFQAWVYGTWGATAAGWGLVVAFVAHHAIGRRQRWAWWALALGVSFWFVLDTAISLVHGVAFNVLFNVVVAGLVAAPLVATRSLARRQPPGSGR